MNFRIGFGFDVHPFAENRKLILGGIEIPSDKGLEGHSDADVLLHAISDALLGSLSLGDIGFHFPNTDPKWKDLDSIIILRKSYDLITQKGYKISNIDCMLAMEYPKISPFLNQMKKLISVILEIDENQISIKATTTEKLGFVGRSEGVAAIANVLVYKD